MSSAPAIGREGFAASAALSRQKENTHHVRALDGLRGAAVMMVVALHVFNADSATSSHAFNLIYALAHSGWMGVDLFFVLSGFLITQILFTTLQDTHYLRNFYARRFLRIFPLYYGVLTALLLLGPVLHLHLWRALPYYLTYTANLLPSGPVRLMHMPSSAMVISHFWSLQIEEQFYLVWPLMMMFLRTRRNILLAAIAGCAAALAMRCYFVVEAAHFPSEYWVYAYTPCRLDGLLIGGALAILWFSRARLMLIHWAPTVFGVCVMLLVGERIWRHQHGAGRDTLLVTIGFTVVAIACAALIVLVMSRGFVRMLFEERGLCWIGRYSYGIYVLHFIWGYFLLDLISRRLQMVTHTNALSGLLSGLIVMGISMVSAYASFELYERRMLRFKRYFRYQETVRFEERETEFVSDKESLPPGPTDPVLAPALSVP